MPRGGRRPGAGRPREPYEARTLYVSLSADKWARLERDLERLWPYLGPRYRYRARILGLVLLEGLEALRKRYSARK